MLDSTGSDTLPAPPRGERVAIDRPDVDGRMVKVADPASVRFLATEATLSKRVGRTLGYPVRLFQLDDLGVSFEALRARVAPSFSMLPWDEYDTRVERVEFLRMRHPSHAPELEKFLPGYFAGENGLEDIEPLIEGLGDTDRSRFEAMRPYRRRAMAAFVLRKSGPDALAWDIERQPDDAPFAQTPDHEYDYRRLGRRFAPSPPEVTESDEYRSVIKWLAALTAVHRPAATTMRIVCHQMGLVARPSSAVSNTPEGIHQDGADYIVSALVIERRNVEGGESIVYGPDKRTEYLRHTLLEGQGIFQADVGSSLWHWATPVRPIDPDSPHPAVRNILGYDVHLD